MQPWGPLFDHTPAIFGSRPLDGPETAMQSTAQALKKKALSAAVSFAVLGAAPSLAQAQADQDSGVLMVEEIVVTATRREQSIQDIPYNISAVDGELLDQRSHDPRP